MYCTLQQGHVRSLGNILTANATLDDKDRFSH